ncbi:unnamed protein product [Periconia digitata]|uniref:CorA-like transporter domain-containing protein n=1 Tax=Periconia digitata TaxID=1303443 RepID=A0A9W4URL2_9PLEO|nr:unnamed protein product [Periconia digitata]
METLLQSCENFDHYPRNVVQNAVLSHTLRSYYDRLKSEEKLLFNEKQAAVDFLDSGHSSHGFISTCMTSLANLKNVLNEEWQAKGDPKCRFVFLHSPHSRAPLRISRNMLSFLLTYYQVMPSFLDFIFPFGHQIEAKDFYFSGLRDDSRLEQRHRGLTIPRLNRSGNEIRFCYNLRSVERSTSQPGLQWSIRQCAVYHSFDVETGKSLWINVKANKLIKNRIEEATSDPTFDSSGTVQTAAAFSSSLSIHLLLCDWSSENWRWYLNDLEQEFQKLAKDAPYIPIDRLPSPPPSPVLFATSPRVMTGGFSPKSRTGTFQSPRSPRTPRNKTGSFSHGAPSRATTLVDSIPNIGSFDSEQQNCHTNDPWIKAGSMDSHILKKSLHSFYVRVRNNLIGGPSQPSSSHQSSIPLDEVRPASPSAASVKMNPPEMPPNFSEDGDEKPQEIFTVTDLQKLQGIEDKIQETLLVLRLNAEVLEELRQNYHFLTSHSAFPALLRSQCEMDLARFTRSILHVEKDLRMLQSRSENLLRMLENRKNLLNGILQYRGVKANESFARKNQLSAERMEQMTYEMHTIAKKTERETISMRVITTVTLFFLPATFIATFMSTDILRFEDGKQDFQLKALHTYMAIALPLTALTFFAWWFISYWAKRPAAQAEAV